MFFLLMLILFIIIKGLFLLIPRVFGLQNPKFGNFLIKYFCGVWSRLLCFREANCIILDICSRLYILWSSRSSCRLNLVAKIVLLLRSCRCRHWCKSKEFRILSHYLKKRYFLRKFVLKFLKVLHLLIPLKGCNFH